jgi:CRAL/TRIO, N-terminal domain
MSLEYKYPLNTPGSDVSNTTFYGNLSEENKEILQVTKRAIDEKGIDLKGLSSFEPLHDDLTILRFLRANNMNVEKAVKHMENNVSYRKEIGVADIMTKSPEENLGDYSIQFIHVYTYIIYVSYD